MKSQDTIVPFHPRGAGGSHKIPRDNCAFTIMASNDLSTWMYNVWSGTVYTYLNICLYIFFNVNTLSCLHKLIFNWRFEWKKSFASTGCIIYTVWWAVLDTWVKIPTSNGSFDASCFKENWVRVLNKNCISEFAHETCAETNTHLGLKKWRRS